MNSLPATHAHVWSMLHAGLADPRAPARFVTLATVGQTGAEARIVVLRGVDEDAATVTFHSDGRAGKVGELSTNPNATALIWDPEARLQIRLRLAMDARTGTPDEWAALSDSNRQLYGGAPAPGAPLDTPEAHAIAPDASQFFVLTGPITQIETLLLGEALHQRALFTREDDFRGQWITP